MTDMVNHPPHYTSHPSGVEVIQITRNCSFDVGNAIKYMMRHNHKGAAVQDLQKAHWYLKDHLSNFYPNQGYDDPKAITSTGKDYLRRVIHSEILDPTLPGHLTLAFLAMTEDDFEQASDILGAYVDTVTEDSASQ